MKPTTRTTRFRRPEIEHKPTLPPCANCGSHRPMTMDQARQAQERVVRQAKGAVRTLYSQPRPG